MRLFSISKKGRFASFLLVLVGFSFVSQLLGISDMDSSAFATSLVAYLFLVWLLLRKDIRYFRTSSENLWSKWDACSDSEQQQSRMMRAASGEVVVKSIDKKARCAQFVGSKTYKTTLSSCSCPDFRKRRIPCKHMYKLASDLDLVQLPDPNFEQ